MTKRNGISLVNVMVFMLFAGMVTAQVFFFMSSSMDSIGEEREIMMYRLRLDTLVEEAKEALEKNGDGAIYHNPELNKKYYDISAFSDDTRAKIKIADVWKGNWEKDGVWSGTNFDVRIHDLDYSFDANFTRDEWKKYSGSHMYRKVFAAMNPPVISGDVTTNASGDIIAVNYRYYLIRAYATLPQKFYGQHLMYQVLVRRNEDNNEVDTLSFQEVWF